MALTEQTPDLRRPALGSLRARYLRGASWSTVGTAASQALNLVAAVVVARMLGRDGYGELGIVMRTTAAFGTFAGIGLGTTVNRYLAELREGDPARAGRVWGLIDTTAMITSSVVGLAVLISAPYVATHGLKAPHLAPLLWLSIITLVFNTMMGVQNAALAGFEAFRKTAAVYFARGLLNLPAMVLTTWFFGLTGAVAGLGLAAFSGFLVGRISLVGEARRFGVPLIRRGAWGERQILWKYSAPIFFSSAVLITGEWLCEAIMFRQPDGKAQMGLYLAAIQWTAAIEFLQNTLASPAVSLMSNLYWTNDLVRFRKLCLANIGLIAGASGAIAGVLAIAAPWIMRAYGSGFGPAAHVLQLVCVMAAVRAVSRATSTVLFSVGKVRVEWAFSMVRIALQISLWYALVSRGAAGLAIAMLGAYLAQLILQGGYVYALLRHSRTGAEAVDSAGGLS